MRDCTTEEYRAQRRDYYRRAKDKFIERNKKRHAANRDWCRSLKSNPCSRCGGTFPPVCMDWHHRDPNTKLFELSAAPRHGRKKVLEEIAKCDLVCANCHRIIESELAENEPTALSV